MDNVGGYEHSLLIYIYHLILQKEKIMKAENVKLGIAPIGWTNDDLPELGAEHL